MAGPRSYDRNTVASLAYLSGGRCYFPGCPDPVFRKVDDLWHLVGEIAHIWAAKPNGPRYNANMSDADRRAIANLMIFCNPHHDIVDKTDNEKIYPAATLRAWKVQHEADPQKAVQRLREVSPAGLRKIVADGLQRHDALMIGAITRLESSDKQAAQLLRSLIDELTEAYANQRRSLNPDLVELLNSATDKMARYSWVAEALDSATSRLEKAAKQLPEW
jgi:hypothetical protein